MLRFINRTKKSERKMLNTSNVQREEDEQITTIDGINRLLHTEEMSDEQKID